MIFSNRDSLFFKCQATNTRSFVFCSFQHDAQWFKNKCADLSTLSGISWAHVFEFLHCIDDEMFFVSFVHFELLPHSLFIF